MARPRFATVLDHFHRWRNDLRDRLSTTRTRIAGCDQRLAELADQQRLATQLSGPGQAEQLLRHCQHLAGLATVVESERSQAQAQAQALVAELALAHRRVRSLEFLQARDANQKARQADRRQTARLDELAAREPGGEGS